MSVMLKELVGKTVIEINKSNELLGLRCSDGNEYRFCHEQDCCESVWLVEEEFTSIPSTQFTIKSAKEDEEMGELIYKQQDEYGSEYDYSDGTYTDSKYTFETDKGDFLLYFRGESNGYYSEDVTIQKYFDDRGFQSWYLDA